MASRCATCPVLAITPCPVLDQLYRITGMEEMKYCEVADMVETVIENVTHHATKGHHRKAKGIDDDG